MITITDATGHSLTIDDAELTVTEIKSRIEKRLAMVAPAASFTFNQATWGDPFAPVHRPAPTSARWEGPPPKRRGRR